LLRIFFLNGSYEVEGEAIWHDRGSLHSPAANKAQIKNRFDILPRYVCLLHTQTSYFPMAVGMRERVECIVVGVLN
jgi:hypothetical protein